MESQQQVTSIELTRQERLLVWMNRNGITFSALGKLMGITGVNARRRLESDTIPPPHYESWSKIIPADLLPESKYLKPGPKPKADSTNCVAA
jgi:hypothetical protein